MSESDPDVPRRAARAARRFGVPVALVVVSLVFCLWFIPNQLLDPSNVGWVFGTGPRLRDDAGHAIQAMAFGQEPWSWPPGRLTNFGGPVGASIIYAAVSPVFAFPAKALESLGLIGQFWQFIGIQALLGICLTVLAVYFLARALNASKIASATVALMTLTLPALTRDVINESLTWQFLAIVPMILLLKDKSPDRPRWPWLVLAVLAAGSNTYFLVPVAAFFVAHLWMTRRRYRVAWRDLAGQSLALAVAVILLQYLSGGFLVPLTGLSGGGEYALTVFRANVLALVDSRGLGVTRALSVEPSDEGWSYLGIAVLALLAAGCLLLIVRHFRRVRHSRHTGVASTSSEPQNRTMLVPTVVVAVALFVLSFSPTIGFGTIFTIRIPLPNAALDALSTFRAVGRFSWPLMYLLLALAALAIDALIATVTTEGRSRRYVLGAFCFVLVLTQAAEARPLLLTLQTLTSVSAEQLSPFDPPLDAAVADSSEIEFVPAYGGDLDSAPFRLLSYYSLKHGVPMNTYHWLARLNENRALQIQNEGKARAVACKWEISRVYAVSRAFLPEVAKCRYRTDLLWSNESWIVMKLRQNVTR